MSDDGVRKADDRVSSAPITHRLDSRARLGVSVVAGAVAAFIASRLGPWELVVLAGWDAAALCYLGVAWSMIVGLDGQATERLATREDDSRAVVDVILLLASLASLVGVVAGLAHDGGKVASLTVIALVTVVLSWLTVHSCFTLRYAHLYYIDPVGGISFGDEHTPDYMDFAYLAFTIGMTFQVSDTEVFDRATRRTITRHALLSYLFGTVIVGVSINVVGSLIG
jgi:uncharacterized membrane protein